MSATGELPWTDFLAKIKGLSCSEFSRAHPGVFWLREAESNCCRVVPVKRVIEEFTHFPIDDLLQFQSGDGATLAEWLRYRFDRCGGIAWSEAADGYVFAVR